MSQHDFDITPEDADTGILVRAEINAALKALAIQSSGATAPTTTYAYQLWADTATGRLKQRNAANNGWIDKGPLNLGSIGIQTIVCPAGINELIIPADMIAFQTVVMTFDSTSGTAFTVTMPTAAEVPGVRFVYKKLNLGGCAITIGATVDGVANRTISSKNQVIDMISDGVAWRLIGQVNQTVQSSTAEGYINNDGTITIHSAGTGTSSGHQEIRPDYCRLAFLDSVTTKNAEFKAEANRAKVLAESLSVLTPGLGLQAAPAAYNSTGSTGDVRFTSTHIYVCVGTNSWKRAALSTW